MYIYRLTQMKSRMRKGRTAATLQGFVLKTVNQLHNVYNDDERVSDVRMTESASSTSGLGYQERLKILLKNKRRNFKELTIHNSPQEARILTYW